MNVYYQALIIGGKEAKVNEYPWAALLLLRSSRTNRTSRCGGSLISNRHVLTAAHCIKDFSLPGQVIDVWDDTTVVLGEIEITIFNGKYNSECFSGEHDIEDGTETVNFKSKTVGLPHPWLFYRLSSGDLDYDVGLLTLETPLNFTDPTFAHIRWTFGRSREIILREEYFRPICLGEGDDLSLSLSERTGVVAGWGATEVSYSHTLCGYIKGETDPDSASNVLKKVKGLR